jgi:SAM-dependent methyltransferase
LTADIFGFNAVQIGMPQLDALAASRMPYKLLADRKVRTLAEAPRRAALTLDPPNCRLPQSMDLVVLPHVLEFSPDPHQVLREVERVLIRKGRSSSAASTRPACGARARCCGASAVPAFAAHGGADFYAAHERLVKIAEYDASQSHFGCYAPACRTQKWLTATPSWIMPAALVAVSGRRLHRAGDQARQRHAPDRSGMEQKNSGSTVGGAGDE